MNETENKLKEKRKRNEVEKDGKKKWHCERKKWRKENKTEKAILNLTNKFLLSNDQFNVNKIYHPAIKKDNSYYLLHSYTRYGFTVSSEWLIY